MALVTSGSGAGPVINEVEMNSGTDPSATTVRATVVQASTVFYDTPATLGTHALAFPIPPLFFREYERVCGRARARGT